MDNDGHPETLVELLRTLERSSDLRSLARESGLSVRELRRRLAIWRREIQAEGEDGEGGKIVRPEKKAKAAGSADWPDLPRAEDLERSPLPDGGRKLLTVHTDGASRGNPGPASIGVVFGDEDGEPLCVYGEAIGRATNNVAEYRAVVTALEHCRRWGVKRVHLNMDSELIVRQIHGTYRVKSPDLRPLYQQVVFLSRDLAEFRVRHVKRHRNAHADALANAALDAEK